MAIISFFSSLSLLSLSFSLTLSERKYAPSSSHRPRETDGITSNCRPRVVDHPPLSYPPHFTQHPTLSLFPLLVLLFAENGANNKGEEEVIRSFRLTSGWFTNHPEFKFIPETFEIWWTWNWKKKEMKEIVSFHFFFFFITDIKRSFYFYRQDR